MADAKWTTPASVETWMSTELNSLANAAGEVPGAGTPAPIDADAYGQLYADIELYVTFGSAPTAGNTIELHFLRSLDGTNFEDYTRGAAAVGSHQGSERNFVLTAATTQRIILSKVELPSLDFLPMLINRSAQAFSASGNTLKARRYTERSV